LRRRRQRTIVDIAWFDEQLFAARTSLRAIARRGRFSASSLSRIIHGKIPLNLVSAIVLADAFGVPIEEIVYRCAFHPPLPKDPKSRQKTIGAGQSKAQIARLRASD